MLSFTAPAAVANNAAASESFVPLTDDQLRTIDLGALVLGYTELRDNYYSEYSRANGNWNQAVQKDTEIVGLKARIETLASIEQRTTVSVFSLLQQQLNGGAGTSNTTQSPKRTARDLCKSKGWCHGCYSNLNRAEVRFTSEHKLSCEYYKAEQAQKTGKK